jgi:hypothetical protein
MNKFFKNPYINSILAEVYIIIVVSVIQFFGKPNTPDTPFDGIVALSLFVLSAAVMGYLFLGEPLQLYLNGEKERSIKFFMKTVVSYAVITLIAIIILKVLR